MRLPIITIYLINEIVWEIKERAQLNAGNTYESLAFARWRDPKIQDWIGIGMY